jgi:cytochrome P450
MSAESTLPHRGGRESVSFDPYDYDFHEDPYPIYRRLREHAPVYRNDDIGFTALSRHADVLAAFKDHVHFSNAKGITLEQESLGEPEAFLSFLGMDPPRHDQMRGLVSRGFTPRRVAELEPHIRELAVHYVDRFIDRGRCDFVEDFAGRLPMDVVSEMLGVPEADRDELRRLADLVLHREEGMRDVPPAGIEAATRLHGYFGDLLAERKKKPGDDLCRALLDAELDGARLTDMDIVGFLFLMIIAGNETTTKLLANALYWLSKNRDQRDLVSSDPQLIPLWVEETLRYDNSTQAMARTMARDSELHGVRLREGDKVLLLIGSANRDGSVFPDPDRFDIRRDTSESLAFGRGVHFCLGASLARLEACIALEEIQRRIPDFEIDMAGVMRVHSANVRGFSTLPITFG